ncbi:AHH domain-containing protein [Pontimicrobium sp. SW4]|uniref:AHH domain-containing protein n=1 Tax=Pontimicrobium sp. SW4 TaxID=3153519 RepID=A0AAU7BP82_9FLAO
MKSTKSIAVILFSLLFLNLISCDKENVESKEPIQEKLKQKIKITTISDYKNDAEFREITSKFGLEKIIDNESSSNDNERISKKSDFLIDTDVIKKVETDSLTTYTMLIERQSKPATVLFENLVIEKRKDSISGYFVAYTFDKPFLQQNQKENISGTVKISPHEGDIKELIKRINSQAESNAFLRADDECETIEIIVETSCPCEGHWSIQQCTCNIRKPTRESFLFNTCDSDGGNFNDGATYYSDGGATGGGSGNPNSYSATVIPDEDLETLVKSFLSTLSNASRNYYLNNPAEKDLIFDYLNDNEFSESSMDFAEELIDIVSVESINDIDAFNFVLAAKKQNKIYSDIDGSFLLSVDQFTNLDLSISDDHDPIIAHFMIKMAVLRALNPEWSDIKVFWEATRDVVHIALDGIGLIPVVGELADFLNGGLYLLEGDGVNASLSFAATVPIFGWTATGAKYAVKLTNTVTGQTTKLVWKVVNNVIDFGRSSQLRKVLGLLPGNPQQAHHLVPWALRNNPVVQKAANSIYTFHMNDVMNGIAVAAWRNQPNHNLYNQKVQALFDALPESLTPDEAFEQVNNIVTNIRNAIIDNPNTHLNDLIF